MKISRISLLHCYKLVFRSLLLLAALALYIVGRVKGSEGLFGGLEENRVVLGIIWGAFAFEMVLRFFPNKSESMGCQKQFGRNYRPYEGQEHAHIRTVPHRAWRTWICLAAWLTLNIPFGILYYAGVLDAGILVLISLAYAVCDMICILFFCPFQTWILKNKCCTTCRIYNWDFAMMFTPLMFIWHPVTVTLSLLSLALLFFWEVQYRLYPERFAEETNSSLACSHCKEKLCHHKKQLRRFLDRQRQVLLKLQSKLNLNKKRK